MLFRYRAKIKKVLPGSQYTIIYIDYGNSETVPISSLRPLPSSCSITTLPAQSHECTLASVKFPSIESDYGFDALDRFKDFTEGKSLPATLMSKALSNPGVYSIILYTNSQRKESVNEVLIREGLALHSKKKSSVITSSSISEKGKKKNFDQVLVEAQEEARKERVKISLLHFFLFFISLKLILIFYFHT